MSPDMLDRLLRVLWRSLGRRDKAIAAFALGCWLLALSLLALR